MNGAHENGHVAVKLHGDKIRAVNPTPGKPRSKRGTPNVPLRWISELDEGLYDALNKGMCMATEDGIV